MANTKGLVVVDELVGLTCTVWSVLEFSRQKTTVKIVMTEWVDQEAHSGKQVEMLYNGKDRILFRTGLKCTTLGR